VIDTPDASGREPETAPPASVFHRRRSIVAVAAGIAVLALAIALSHATNRTHDRTAAAWTGPPSSSDIGAVMALLEDHGRALMARDQAAWATALDDASQSRAYADSQRALFDNIRDVPLTAWRYALVAPALTESSAASTRLSAHAVVLHVRLSYGLAGADPQPTSHEQWLTAVHRASGWKLAGDSDAATAGGNSWHGMWDFGPVRSRVGAHTLVLAHLDHARDLAMFAGLVERAIPYVDRVWGTGWNQHVAVLIPDTPAEFAQVSSDSGDTSDLAAVAVADQVLPDATVLGARIVLNPSNLARLDAAGRRLVVQHELTHVAARAATNDQMPTWVIEGFADYVGNLGSGRTPPQIAGELAAEVRSGSIPAALPSNADFAGSNPRLAQIYEESWLACSIIQQRAGTAGLVRFYKAVSAAAATDPATATDVGL
jgi:hypothetical protein